MWAEAVFGAPSKMAPISGSGSKIPARRPRGGLRLPRSDAAGVELGTAPANRLTVNVGTVPVSPHPSSLPAGEDGKAHRRLMTPGRGGGSVVLRARESRVHGEGGQQVCRGTGGKKVAGEHRRAVADARGGRGPGTSPPAQAAQVGIDRQAEEVPRPVEPRVRPRHPPGGVAQ